MQSLGPPSDKEGNSIPYCWYDSTFVTGPLKTNINTFATLSMQHNTFIQSVICLTTGPTPLSKWFLHIVRSRASSFK